MQSKHPLIPFKTYIDVAKIMHSGKLSGFRGAPGEYYLGGKWVRKLEDAFCEYFNVPYAIAMNSATSCLHVALQACGIGVGDEVIVSPYSFSSSASCVLMVGATPIFCDIDEKTFCMDIRQIKITKPVIPVHLMGLPMYIPHSPMIEDCAQALGAERFGQKVGTFGRCGVFSFNQSKHVSSGEGGILITSDEHIATYARAIRNHAEVSNPDLATLGYNFRMNEIEACIAYHQFKELDWKTEIRIELANYMTEKLKQIDGFTPPYVPEECKHVFYTYAVKVDEKVIGMPRDDFQKRMLDRGIYFGAGYVKPLYLLPIYQQFGYKEGLCPVAERMWKHELCVFDWLRAGTTKRDVDKTIKVIKEVLHEV